MLRNKRLPERPNNPLSSTRLEKTTILSTSTHCNRHRPLCHSPPPGMVYHTPPFNIPYRQYDTLLYLYPYISASRHNALIIISIFIIIIIIINIFIISPSMITLPPLLSPYLRRRFRLNLSNTTSPSSSVMKRLAPPPGTT